MSLYKREPHLEVGTARHEFTPGKRRSAGQYRAIVVYQRMHQYDEPGHKVVYPAQALVVGEDRLEARALEVARLAARQIRAAVLGFSAVLDFGRWWASPPSPSRVVIFPQWTGWRYEPPVREEVPLPWSRRAIAHLCAAIHAAARLPNPLHAVADAIGRWVFYVANWTWPEREAAAAVGVAIFCAARICQPHRMLAQIAGELIYSMARVRGIPADEPEVDDMAIRFSLLELD